jgi:hypothetical protein
VVVSFWAERVGALTLGVDLEITVGVTMHWISTFDAEVRELTFFTDTSDG